MRRTICRGENDEKDLGTGDQVREMDISDEKYAQDEEHPA